MPSTSRRAGSRDSRQEHGSTRSGAQAIERAVGVLWAAAESTDGLGVTEIAQEAGLRVSTAHRIVRALVAADLMEQDRRTERYRLGGALHLLGMRAAEQLGYQDARGVLDELAHETGESASLGIRRDRSVQVVLVSSSDQRLRYDHELGGAIPVHASAMGKVLLAYADGDPRSAVGSLGRLERFTPRTVTTKRDLSAQLAAARQQGYAINDEERYVGVVGIAAPVTDWSGRVVAAVGVQGPRARFDKTYEAKVARAVVRAGQQLSHQSGA